MQHFFDRKRNSINLLTWGRLKENTEYVIVAQFEDDRIRISTVWTGNVMMPEDEPLIFETMTFVKKTLAKQYDLCAWRWRIEEEAKQGHEILVCCYQDGIEPEEPMEAVIQEFDERVGRILH
jgi:hypothetical protein